MMISFACPGCGKKFSVPEQYAGKRAKCKQCGQMVQVPAPAPAAPEPEVDFAALEAMAATPGPAAPAPPVYAPAPPLAPGGEAPLPVARRPRRIPKRLIRVGVICLLALALGGGVWYGVWRIFLRSPARDCWYMIPDDPKQVKFVNVAKLRGTSAYADYFEKQSDIRFNTFGQLTEKEVDWILVIDPTAAPRYTIARTRSDRQPGDFNASPSGFWAIGATLHVEKLGSRLFLISMCFDPQFQQMKNCAARKAEPRLIPEVKEALDRVSGFDHFSIKWQAKGTTSGFDHIVPRIEADGASVGRSVKAVVYRTYYAESYAKEHFDGLMRYLQDPKRKDSPVGLGKGIEVARDGMTMQITGECSADNLGYLISGGYGIVLPW